MRQFCCVCLNLRESVVTIYRPAHTYPRARFHFCGEHADQGAFEARVNGWEINDRREA